MRSYTVTPGVFREIDIFLYHLRVELEDDHRYNEAGDDVDDIVVPEVHGGKNDDSRPDGGEAEIRTVMFIGKKSGHDRQKGMAAGISPEKNTVEKVYVIVKQYRSMWCLRWSRVNLGPIAGNK